MNTLKTIAVCALLACASGQIHAQTAIDTGTSSVRAGEPVTLNFANAEIEAVARTLATITGRNVVVDPRVKGQLTLVTDRPVTPTQAFQQFLAALRLQGFTVVESAGLYKVVPEADAKLQGGSVNVSQGGASGVPAGGQVVTQIFKLNFENANNLVPVLRPLISPNNTINVNPGNNSLVITDYADNLQRIARIVAAMDVANASDIEVIPLRNALASDMAPLVQKLLDSATTGGSTPAAGNATPTAAASGEGGYRTTVLPEPRSNALIVRAANPARVALVRSLVSKLDLAPLPGSPEASGNIRVVYLKHADAVQLAATLRAAMAAMPGASASGASAATGATGTTGGQGSTTTSTSSSSTTSSTTSSTGGLGSTSATSSGLPSNTAQPSTGGQIQADPASNALIISAPEPQYRQMRAVIDMLDTRRAQVYIEALISEISADDTSDLGVQWLGLASSGNGYVGSGTNFGTTGNLFTNIALAAAGSTSGYTYNQGLNIGLYKGSLAVLANALQSKTRANILSTPTLLTLDNQEAKILIGKNVPVATGSYSTTSSSSTVNPYTTYERMDVGLTLNIKPQINADGTVKLQIYQEISSISGSLNSSETTSSTNLVTNKRSIVSTVLVQDGTTAVLGGLIQDQLDISVSSVPVLGELPVIGSLFRSQSRSRTKTNLMIFLRPVVLRDTQSSGALALDRYDSMRTLQILQQPTPSSVLNVNKGPVLPPTPNAQPGAGTPPPPLVHIELPIEASQPAAPAPAPAAP
ncbi:MAG: type II secretion system secretin GspD [Acidovorax sp.]|uniref:type II secretion system secretin GspD n=1 Tax=Acidovorax sp. TaxID=1872122 RepID=UPI0039E49454